MFAFLLALLSYSIVITIRFNGLIAGMWTERSRWYETRTVRATVFGARVRLQRPTAETSAAGVRRYVATASKRLQARVESPPGGSASATRRTRCCVGF